MDIASGFHMLLTIFLLIALCNGSENTVDHNIDQDLFDIEGQVLPPEYLISGKWNWLKNTKVVIKGGQYVGFISADGSFIIPKVPSGSYVLEVLCNNYVYEPIRVDINSRGKYRARKMNYIQTSQVSTLPYPLKFRTLGMARYFQPREQWRITDLLMNPMVLMMVLPMLCIMLLPRIMNDPEAKRELEQFQGLSKYDMPEVSEMITSFFSGGSDKQVVRTMSAGTSKHGNRKGSKNN